VTTTTPTKGLGRRCDNEPRRRQQVPRHHYPRIVGFSLLRETTKTTTKAASTSPKTKTTIMTTVLEAAPAVSAPDYCRCRCFGGCGAPRANSSSLRRPPPRGASGSRRSSSPASASAPTPSSLLARTTCLSVVVVVVVVVAAAPSSRVVCGLLALLLLLAYKLASRYSNQPEQTRKATVRKNGTLAGECSLSRRQNTK